MAARGLINSGGASGANDFEEAVATAVINKRAGGTGLISGRKAFQRPMKEGVQLLNAIQDVYSAPKSPSPSLCCHRCGRRDLSFDLSGRNRSFKTNVRLDGSNLAGFCSLPSRAEGWRKPT